MLDINANKIKSFGAVGYSPETIADLLTLSGKDRAELIVRLSLHGDELYNAYKQGMAIGEWNIDAELAKQAENGDVESIQELAERSKQRKLRDMKKELFGI